MNISIIIPTFNEEAEIASTLREIKKNATGSICELIVVDGGSKDKTRTLAKKEGAKVLESSRKGRATQMNLGAAEATGEILYFLHADSLPPDEFDKRILKAYNEGFDAGCFRLQFDDPHPVLSFYAWFTQFDFNAFRFGDQSLFIEKKLFEDIGGYRSDLFVMEDNEIVRRIKRKGSFTVLSEKVVTSARKYRENGVIKLQLIFTLIYILFFLGVSQEKLISTYNSFLTNEKPVNLE